MRAVPRPEIFNMGLPCLKCSLVTVSFKESLVGLPLLFPLMLFAFFNIKDVISSDLSVSLNDVIVDWLTLTLCAVLKAKHFLLFKKLEIKLLNRSFKNDVSE